MSSTQTRVAVVTGGGSGIGRAAAVALAGSGYQVVVAGRRPEALIRTVEEAGAASDRVRAIPTDVTDPDAVQALFAATVAAFGRVDVLFNNAGRGAPPVPFEDLTLEQWRSVIDVNLTGMFLCAQAAVRQMKAQSPRGGRIINNGSISATSPRPNSAPYTATKHAVTGLTKSLALDGRRHDVACSQIDIGNAATDLTERMKAGVPQANGTVVPEPRMDVAHVGQAILQIANFPLETNVLFMTIMATQMPFVGRG